MGSFGRESLPPVLLLLLASCSSTTGLDFEFHTKPQPLARITWTEEEPLPRPLSNNAVAALNSDGKYVLYSFMGLDETKSFAGITRAAYSYDPDRRTWTMKSPLMTLSGPRARRGGNHLF